MGRIRIAAVVTFFVSLVLLVAGCASLEQSITLEMVYPSENQSNVTVHYTVPPPPPGKVYVLWILNPDENHSQNMGEIRSGQNMTTQTSVNFQATGAIVSVENSPNVTSMSNTWALKVGQIAPSTATPTVSGPTPTPLPFAPSR